MADVGGDLADLDEKVQGGHPFVCAEAGFTSEIVEVSYETFLARFSVKVDWNAIGWGCSKLVGFTMTYLTRSSLAWLLIMMVFSVILSIFRSFIGGGLVAKWSAILAGGCCLSL